MLILHFLFLKTGMDWCIDHVVVRRFLRFSISVTKMQISEVRSAKERHL
jgi:hypothetical protein